MLEQRGQIRILIDTRTNDGARSAFGGPYPSLCLYALRTFIDENPVAMQRMTNALVAALRYLHRQTSADLIDVIAPKYKLGERGFAIKMIDRSRQLFSRDGKFDPNALMTPLRIMSAFDDKIAAAGIDLSRTYTNRFVDAVPPSP